MVITEKPLFKVLCSLGVVHFTWNHLRWVPNQNKQGFYHHLLHCLIGSAKASKEKKKNNHHNEAKGFFCILSENDVN